MKKNQVIALVFTFSLIASVATTALATTVNVGGGTWEYGVYYYTFPYDHKVGYSYYNHPTNVHTSTVKVDSTYYRSSNAAPGNTSVAESAWTTSNNISCYYNPEV